MNYCESLELVGREPKAWEFKCGHAFGVCVSVTASGSKATGACRRSVSVAIARCRVDVEHSSLDLRSSNAKGTLRLLRIARSWNMRSNLSITGLPPLSILAATCGQRSRDEPGSVMARVRFGVSP